MGKFIKVYKEIYQHEKFRQLDGDHIIYYSWLLDLNELSKKNKKKYTDGDGRLFVIFPEINARYYCNIKKGKLYRVKKKLKEVGLIDYNEQKVKKEGVSTPIYVTPYEHWMKKEKSEIPGLDEMPDL
ncbi:replication initiator protein A [Sporolactobacillus terrae]|uniref:replication initiator protein A n=1 Tax=Sporolactobacillus terrae TaxID=269673 RepID=UPI001CBE7C95|nr:replication initiator protein A [Sporolactobacillus terrae]UAK16114.1 replication initiator protein A [Sporolactobacillus terrae]